MGRFQVLQVSPHLTEIKLFWNHTVFEVNLKSGQRHEEKVRFSVWCLSTNLVKMSKCRQEWDRYVKKDQVIF